MNEIVEKYLPLGSVVILKGGQKRLMITGFLVSPTGEKTKVYDYSGVIFPEGMLSSDKTALFNHEQIERIDFLGFVDDEEKQFKIKLNELISKGFNEDESSSGGQELKNPITQDLKDLGFNVENNTENVEIFNV